MMSPLRFVSVHEMLSLDPNSRLADSSSATPLLKLVCPNLVRLDHDLAIRPALASAYTVSDNARVFRFTLRPDLRFHNGRGITAAQVARNFERMFDSRVGSLLAGDFAGTERVAALGENEVEFRFAEPFPAFLHHLAGRCHIADDNQTQPVGAGPFRVTDWVRGSHLVMKRFEGYFESNRPLAEEVYVTWAPQAADRIKLIEDGAVDVVEIVPGGAAKGLEERRLLVTQAAASTRKLSVCFNCAAPPFDDIRMRQAVAYTIDRDLLVATFLAGFGAKFDAAYAPGSEWAADVEPIERDLDAAARLVAAAGYSQGITIKTIATNVAPVPRVAETVAMDLAQIGIRLDVRGYDDPPWWPLIYLDTDWQMAFQGMGPRTHPDFLFRREFVTGGPFNATRFSDPRLDEVVHRARRTVDPAEQRRLYREAQILLRAGLPTVPLYSMDILSGWRPGVTGYRPHPLQYWELAETTAG
jgi:ABC-type transport system substrate-binding protein